MAITPPRLNSMLSVPQTANNFIAMQSASLSPGTASASVTFTNIPSTGRVTFKFFNSGTKDCYIAGGHTTAVAVVASATPQPTSGPATVSNCDCIPHGAILTQDYIGGTDTIAAICAGTDSTVLQISIGGGQ